MKAQPCLPYHSWTCSLIADVSNSLPFPPPPYIAPKREKAYVLKTVGFLSVLAAEILLREARAVLPENWTLLIVQMLKPFRRRL